MSIAAALAFSAPAVAQTAAGAPATPPADPPRAAPEPATPAAPTRPPPLHAQFAQYGIALNAVVNMFSGATCGANVHAPGKPPPAPPPPGSMSPFPCILGSGGGLVIRGGRRSPGPWYIGGAYAFAKLDASNLFRLGILQQAWAEMRFLPDFGQRIAPYATWGLGGVAYGNEWGVETGGAMLFGGGGFEFEVSRLAVVGLGAVYKPTLFVGWTDTASIVRPTGVAHFLGLELQLEVRTEIGRR